MSQTCLFDDKSLPSLLDTHLLQEHVHDNQHHNREKHRIILYFIYFEHNETLVKQVNVQVGVQRHLQLAATVDLFQYGRKVMYIETDFLQLCNLRYAFQGKLIIGIERESS